MKKYDYILIDTMMLCYRAWFSLGSLNIKVDGETHGTAIPVGLMKSILYLAEKYANDDTKIILCLDSKTKDLHRKRIYPGYKAKRKEQYTKEQMKDLFDQVKLAMKMVSLLPIYQSGRFGFESDDVMFSLAKRYKSKGDVLIVSSDKDLYQSLDKRVFMLVNREQTVMTRKRLKKEKGFTPKEFLTMQCLMGDPADCIPGIKGIGEKTALAIVKAYPDILEDIFSHSVDLDRLPGLARNKFNKDMFDTVDLTKMLVGMTFIRNLALKPGSGDKKEIMELLDELKAFSLSLEVDKNKWLASKWNT